MKSFVKLATHIFKSVSFGVNRRNYFLNCAGTLVKEARTLNKKSEKFKKWRANFTDV